MAETKDGFLFYRSYIEAIDKLPAERRYAFIHAIADYALDGLAPEFDGAEDIAFTLMKANIDSCNKRYSASVENGKKGGRPPKASYSETQRKPNQNPKDNVNDTVKVNHLHTEKKASRERVLADAPTPKELIKKNGKKYEVYTTESGEERIREIANDTRSTP